jgi:hypothetical protein
MSDENPTVHLTTNLCIMALPLPITAHYITAVRTLALRTTAALTIDMVCTTTSNILVNIKTSNILVNIKTSNILVNIKTCGGDHHHPHHT